MSGKVELYIGGTKVYEREDNNDIDNVAVRVYKDGQLVGRVGWQV